MTQDERNALLKLADHVDVLVRFCAAHMPSERKDQYDAGANAFWSIVHRIAGDDDKANEMAARVPPEVVRPPDVTPERIAAYIKDYKMARRTKKALLKAMEGKNHDRKPPYSRKGRGKKNAR